ncbi:MAG: glutamine-hydrolyzing GMP synthase [Eubacteriales bacterium]|nr:glutamine-hydrolyzing GMP synthase [Eubacteriales bacterium]MDD3109956.1 glutamine-hydrolyzing GMP synthase [Eubacteriales bacterium]
MEKPILIIDFGSQFTQLIARRVRQAGVFSQVLSHHANISEIRGTDPCGIILSGGPASLEEETAPGCDPAVFGLGVPVLGICYGMQLMAHTFGGLVARSEKREYGLRRAALDTGSALFSGLEAVCDCWNSHGFQVAALPPGFSKTASTDSCPIAGMENPKERLFGVQFHPEVTHSQQGMAILTRFVRDICGCAGNWRMENYAASAVEEIKAAAGNGTVLLGLSGGVDSAVAAALIHQAVGDRLRCVFVDHGFMRKGEPEMVREVFTRHFPVSLTAVDASARFYGKLKGVRDPEEKRRIIGHEFVSVFREEALKLGKLDHFAQGTIYPDVIESGAAPGSAVIKSHHNVGGLPRELGFTSLIEPLRTLFKDEVRDLGRVLGLPEEMVSRQPFPGPGLAIRTLGELTPDKVAVTRESDAILREEFVRSGFAKSASQFFTVNTDIRSVGVMGDGRSYDTAVAIRAVTTDDFMTADWARVPYELLAHISRRITNEVLGVNRVLLDVTTKPPASIEWE